SRVGCAHIVESDSAQHESLNRTGAAGGIVTFNHHSAESDVAVCRLEADWHVVQKPPDDLLFVDPDHALVGTSHSDVGNVGGTFGEDTLVGSRDVGMSSEDSGDS